MDGESEKLNVVFWSFHSFSSPKISRLTPALLFVLMGCVWHMSWCWYCVCYMVPAHLRLGQIFDLPDILGLRHTVCELMIASLNLKSSHMPTVVRRSALWFAYDVGLFTYNLQKLLRSGPKSCSLKWPLATDCCTQQHCDYWGKTPVASHSNNCMSESQITKVQRFTITSYMSGM